MLGFYFEKLKNFFLVFAIVLFIIGSVAFVVYISANSLQSSKGVGVANTEENIDPSAIRVEISSRGFIPKELRIKRGQKVAVRNLDSINHTLSSKAGNEISSLALKYNDVYQHSFDTLGTYEYFSNENPSFKGTIIVTE